MNDTAPAGPRRRTVLCGAALAGAAGLGLTACGSGSGSDALPARPVELGPASDVPVGEAKLYRDKRILVARTAEDEYKAFSAVCTHQGCPLDEIRDGLANCPCHRSLFDPATGRAEQGPAVDPLPSVPVRVENGRLVAGSQ
ncbi:Rieske (2Fe-2S) protein [Streptomyces thermolineatus]|uniref:Rieske (2Fe-2S) protein n=1 Tax=Streptomyces thermolineatus TaxID=44033 RepID=UPI00384A94CE